MDLDAATTTERARVTAPVTRRRARRGSPWASSSDQRPRRLLRPSGGYEEFHPYGTTAWWADPGSTVSQKRYRYTGKEKDEESGLYYHGARYHAPWLARWTATDPIGLQGGINCYAYCRGNPISRHDPGGTSDVDGGRSDQSLITFSDFPTSKDDTAATVWQRAVKFMYGVDVAPEGGEMALGPWPSSTRLHYSLPTEWEPGEVVTLRISQYAHEQLLDAADPVVIQNTGRGDARVGRQSSVDVAVFWNQHATNDNIRGGLFGSGGFVLGGDEASDVGAAIDANIAAATVFMYGARAALTRPPKLSDGYRGEAYRDSYWNLGASPRGFAFERENAPYGQLPSSFKTIDSATREAVSKDIVSIKSMDLSSSTYRNSKAVQRVIKSHVDRLAAFTSYRRGGVAISADESTTRTLMLIVPAVGSGQGTVAAIKAFEEASAKYPHLQFKLDLRLTYGD